MRDGDRQSSDARARVRDGTREGFIDSQVSSNLRNANEGRKETGKVATRTRTRVYLELHRLERAGWRNWNFIDAGERAELELPRASGREGGT